MTPQARALAAASLLALLTLAPPSAAEDAAAYVGGRLPAGDGRVDARFCWGVSQAGANLSSDACRREARPVPWLPGHVAEVGEVVVGAVILGEEVCYMIDENGSIQECTAFCRVLGVMLPFPWCREPEGGAAPLP